MKKVKPASDELRTEYKRSAFGKLERGKYYERVKASSNVVVLDAEVAAVFPNSAAVNKALHSPVDVAKKASGLTRRSTARSPASCRLAKDPLILAKLMVSAAKNSRSSATLTKMPMKTPAKRFVVCLKNKGYEVSLERRKIYEVIPDPEAAKHRQIRVIDESGDDYLYPESFFTSIELPHPVRKAVLAAL